MQCEILARQAVALCHDLIHLAETGMKGCDNEECLRLYGLILDAAYRIETAAGSRWQGAKILE